MERINPHKDVLFYKLLIAGIFTMLSVMIFLGMDIMEMPFVYKMKVVMLLIGVGVPGPTALFGAFASDSAFFVYTADLFHKKNCHL